MCVRYDVELPLFKSIMSIVLLAKRSPKGVLCDGFLCREVLRGGKLRPLNLTKSPIFTNAPCKTTCLCNAPSMHTVDIW